jgi:hypothetical protein
MQQAHDSCTRLPQTCRYMDRIHLSVGREQGLVWVEVWGA